ncbi:hypothetical protein BBJ28_00023635 [Nothophytophthora sp. Chile5]|nr:hypothetical protein BBJ28_00023635 [Nothophytophthora sp. Chile5]
MSRAHSFVVEVEDAAVSPGTRGEGSPSSFLCRVCYEELPLAHAYSLRDCGHEFCATCVQRYLELQICEGHVFPKCFYRGEDVSCPKAIAERDIHALVSKELWEKYTRFKFNQENANARQCPFCNHSQVHPGGVSSPRCVCAACSREFCFVHSSAHVGETCAQYENKRIEEDALNRQVISEISQPCPGCGSDVEKTGWACCFVLTAGRTG